MPVQTWFDIETTGVSRPVYGGHFLQSSILEIGYTDPTGVQSLQAAPASEKMSTWSYETVWKPLQRRRLHLKNQAMATEQAILERFLTHLQKLPDGSELIGWNIGYNPRVVSSAQAIGGGYDVPGIVTRAKTYGMDKEFVREFQRHTLRDVGQEFSVKLVDQLYNRTGQKGLDQLSKANLLDKAAVHGNRLTLTDELLSYSTSRGVDPWSIYQRLTPEQKGQMTPSSSIEELVTKLGKFTDISDKASSIPSDLRRQAFGFYQRMMSTNSYMLGNLHGVPLSEGTVRETAKNLSMGGTKFAGWAQETIQKTLMEFGGHTVDNPLVKKYASTHNVSPKEALKTLTSSQAHLGKEDVMIAQALTGMVDQFGTMLQDSKESDRFFGIWGKHAQRKKMLSSVSWNRFSGEKIREAKKEGFHGLFTENEFFAELNQQAEAKFGNRGGKGWESELRALGIDETLERKFNLKSDKTLEELGINRPRGLPSQLEGNLFKGVASKIGGRGMAVGAIASAVALQPLSLFDSEGDEFIAKQDKYWQHTILGIPKISGTDDQYNTIEGLRHGGMSQAQRYSLTDFGSGWIPGRGNAEQQSDSRFSLDPNLEHRARLRQLLDTKEITQDEVSRFQRAFKFAEDSALGNFLIEMGENTAGGERFASGYLLSTVGEYLNPGAPTPFTMYGVNLDPAVLEFRKNILQDPGAYADFQEEYKTAQRKGRENLGSLMREEMFREDLSNYKGISLHASNLRAVNLENFALDVEDADTLVLKRKGLFNIFDKPIHVRMTGIDAPEVGSHEHDPMAKWRINQNQPYGQQASEKLRQLISEQQNLSLLVDPSQNTYGRAVGAIFGDDGLNLNLELIKEGAVSALPWGSTEGDIIDRTLAEEYETEAAEGEVGMWRYTRYQAAREMGAALGTDITYNTFTDVTKLAKNPDLAGYASYLEGLGTVSRPLAPTEKSSIRRVSSNLQKTGFGGKRRPIWQKGYNKGGRTFQQAPLPSPSQNIKFKLFQPQIPLTSDDEAYVNIEGLRHGGSAAAGRQRTDFGSGWKAYKNAAKRFYFSRTSETFTRYTDPAPPVSSSVKRKISKGSSSQATVATRGITSPTAAERIGQVKNTTNTAKDIETKNFIRHTHPGLKGGLDNPRISGKIGSNEEALRDLNRLQRRKSTLESVRRKHKFVTGGKMAPILRSKHDHHKIGHSSYGVTNFVRGL